MQYTVEEILDLIAEAIGAIFLIGLFQQFVMGGMLSCLSRMIMLMLTQVLGG